MVMAVNKKQKALIWLENGQLCRPHSALAFPYCTKIETKNVGKCKQFVRKGAETRKEKRGGEKRKMKQKSAVTGTPQDLLTKKQEKERKNHKP